ncbi:MAG: RNA 3'-terminal phosphate cyclase [Planctomycetes bacterium]|nr:RNA 3'-terminal phosphate cyclase [Planctomycetota bacterium]
MLTINGSFGEGGGQILRSSLALSAITGQDFRIENIRANRAKPGLRKQHLTCVNAAAEITGAECMGNALNSQVLEFRPHAIAHGNYKFRIDSAGSTLLVLQTVLPVLFFAPEKSTVTLTGGTHNPMAPPADFIIDSFLPLIARLGFNASLNLKKHGFYPAGGGEIHAAITPHTNEQSDFSLTERGERLSIRGEILLSYLKLNIAEREKDRLSKVAGIPEDDIKIVHIPDPVGPGNAVMLKAKYENISCVFTSFGELGKRAEVVAAEAGQDYIDYTGSAAVADKHLADQLLLYLALNKKGSFTTNEVTEHTRTNMEIIRKFLGIEFKLEQDGTNITITTKDVRAG